MDALSFAGFAALFLAIAALLSPLPPRYALYPAVASLALASLGGVAAAPGIAVCLIGAGLVVGASSQGAPPWSRGATTLLLALYVVAAELSLFPGFHGLKAFEGFGRSASHDLIWRFPKGWAGFLLAWLHRRQIGPDRCPWPIRLRRLVLLPVGTLAVALVGWLAGVGVPNPRVLPGLAMWFVGNLFLVAVAEEGLFRGLIQRDVERWMGRHTEYGTGAAITVTAALFGAAHLPWGTGFALAAGVAGIYYGLMYGSDHRLGWAAAAHAFTNLTVVLVFLSPLG